jgi:hypothetical protein
MRLSNSTGAVAHLHTVDLFEPELRAAVIIKKTYAVAPDGQLRAADDPLPLVADQQVTDYGHFHGEVFFRKRGVDVCVLGTARLAWPAKRARVRLEIGAWHHELRLTGDRFWARDRGGAVVPTAAEPFQEMVVSYSRAFGGVAQAKGEDIAWPDNPIGRGYYESPDEAVGKPLPNIESVIQAADVRWDARVPVAGWGPYPMYWGLRASRAVQTDRKTGEILDISPELFNHAHPDLIVDRVDPGTPVRVIGMRPDPITIVLPRERPHVAVHVGSVVSEAVGEIDGVFMWLDADRLVITWRARFRYPVRHEEIRRASLTFME